MAELSEIYRDNKQAERGILKSGLIFNHLPELSDDVLRQILIANNTIARIWPAHYYTVCKERCMLHDDVFLDDKFKFHYQSSRLCKFLLLQTI